MSANTINRQITGTIAVTNGTVSLPTWGLPVVGLELSGTWVMNLDVKVVVGSTEVDAVVVTGAGAPVSLPLTANQTVFVDAAGAAEVIVRANPRTSGTVTVALNATSGKLPTAPGGSAVSISDGSDAALGAKADAAAGSDTGTFSLIALIKRLLQKFTVLNAFYGLTHNNAAPGATNLGVLAGVATAARPTYTEGDQVLLSTNLGGDMRVIAAGHTPAAPTCTFTRPANITAYTIGDEVGTNGTAPTTIPVARFNGGTGIIQGAKVFYSGYPATVPQLVLLVFSATVTLAGDNQQLSLSDTDAKKLICQIPLNASLSSQYNTGAPVSAGGVWLSGAPARPSPHYICGASEQTLYCCLITLNAFTPIANGETLDCWLDIENN